MQDQNAESQVYIPALAYLSTDGGATVTALAPGVQVVYAEWVLQFDTKKVVALMFRNRCAHGYSSQSPSIFAATLDSTAKTIIDGVNLMRWEYPFSSSNMVVVRTRCFDFEQVMWLTWA